MNAPCRPLLIALVVTLLPASLGSAEPSRGYRSPAQPMMEGLRGWRVTPLVTVGESIPPSGYRMPGIPDGIGAYRAEPNVVRVLVNHELMDHHGYPYLLANGTRLTGARITAIDVHRRSRRVLHAGLAYDRIFDRAGQEVTDATQLHEGQGRLDAGLARFCSGALFEAGDHGLEDTIFFAGEETWDGMQYALDVLGRELHAVPALGRASFENVTLLDTGEPNTVAILIGDDRRGGPLLLYVGEKGAVGDGSFLDRNGLARGRLHAWVSMEPGKSPQEFNGTGSRRRGQFKNIRHLRPDRAGSPGHDALGYADLDTIDRRLTAMGAFRFSRPEDVATDPTDGTRAVLASTGHGEAYNRDNWGALYLVDVEFGGPLILAELTILWDGDDAGGGRVESPDHGPRSPDNLDWADDGMIYVQEDRSTRRAPLFGETSGAEASVWRVNPKTRDVRRIAEMDRTAIPLDQHDWAADRLGVWESSGIVDVTRLFRTKHGEKLFIANVQCPTLVGRSLGDLDPTDKTDQARDLVTGGQLFLLSSGHGRGRQVNRVFERPRRQDKP